MPYTDIMARSTLFALATASLAGCVSQAPVVVGATAPVVVANANTELNPASKLVCHKESPIGSSMIRTVCEAEQSEADRRAIQDQARNLLPNGNLTHPAVGGS
jgi:hypothetical protein